MENKLELPDWLLETVQKTQGEYDPGEKTDFSITSLLVPPMVHALQKKYKPTPDLADQLQAFVGTAGHNQIEWALKDNPRYLVEERLYATIDVPDSPVKKQYTVSAQLDLYDKETGEHWDHKFSKLFSFLNAKEEYEQQLAIQAWLLRLHGYEPKNSNISGFGLDWSKVKTSYDTSYPQSLFVQVPFPQWEDEDCLTFLRERIVEREYAALGQMRQCTPKEMWERPSVYAVKKEGRKSAIKLCYDEQEAQVIAMDKGGYVEHRPGEKVRCKFFCDVWEHCPVGLEVRNG